MDSKIGNVGKVRKTENSETDEERKDEDEEKLCKPIVKRPRKTQLCETRDIGRDWRRRTTRQKQLPHEGVDGYVNTFSIMHIDVSRAFLDAKAQRLVLVRLPVEDRMGADAGKISLLKKSMYGTRDAASNWERLATAPQTLEMSAWTCFAKKGTKFQE